MDITNVLLSGDVTRFHNVPNITAQKNSEHSWGVALLCQYFDPYCSKNLILNALTHDCAELYIGDIPATTKWEYPEIKAILDKIEKKVDFDLGLATFIITPKEKDLLKFCDMIEGMHYCMSRIKAGEQCAGFVFSKWEDAIRDRFTNLTEQQSEMFVDLVASISLLESNYGSK